MKKLLLLSVLISLLFSSCLTFYFSQPLPVDAKVCSRMPRALRGNWEGKEGTLRIDKKRWVSSTVDSNERLSMRTEFELSDSLVLKRYKKYYFFNVLNTNGFWNVYVGQKRNNFFIINRMNRDDSLGLKTRLGIFPDSVSESNLFYRSPISKKQLVKYIEQGGFADTLFLFDIKKRLLVK